MLICAFCYALCPIWRSVFALLVLPFVLLAMFTVSVSFGVLEVDLCHKFHVLQKARSCCSHCSCLLWLFRGEHAVLLCIPRLQHTDQEKVMSWYINNFSILKRNPHWSKYDQHNRQGAFAVVQKLNVICFICDSNRQSSIGKPAQVTW